jgi:hypothetical protein
MMALLLSLVAGTLLQAASPQAAPDPKLIRVFVQTEVSPLALGADGMRESVEDLAEALAAKKKTLVVMETPRDADLVITVIDRRSVTPKFVMGIGTRPGEPPSLAGPARTVALTVTLALGGERVELTNKNKPLEVQQGWKSAAADLAGQIDKWAGSHRSEILKRRGGGVPEHGPSARGGR